MQNSEISQFAKLSKLALLQLSKWQGATVVVKYGGNAMITPNLTQNVMDNVRLLHQFGVKVVLVHGGGPEIAQGLKQIGKDSQFINGLRVTDQETMDIVVQMLAGKVNKNLVSQLGSQGIGLSGVDMAMLVCKKIEAEFDIGFVGEIVAVNPKGIHFALTQGLIPVISTIGTDENGTLYNVNADTATAAIAIAIKADKLVMMTDIAGLLRDSIDESTLISSVNIEDVSTLITEGIISGGMVPKIQCCVEAVKAGVGEVAIIDGRVENAILLEMLGKLGNGTRFFRN
ncbi:N-acetylglutamate kinase [Nicoletella semolina]|uniref:Acetylglutamate kinase n=1 Tax=Nicoletella semolina TaxID=271160 RepID=A0A4R2N6G3_9PAST|nr:acetylglutamate kinase [Nicoletella semolina]MDH2925170.1 acetylglutamate kinase [Nicoletella semolina]TCP16519.1 N-acetylglutamate kinase [Nicoletella semolina]